MKKYINANIIFHVSFNKFPLTYSVCTSKEAFSVTIQPQATKPQPCPQGLLLIQNGGLEKPLAKAAKIAPRTLHRSTPSYIISSGIATTMKCYHHPSPTRALIFAKSIVSGIYTLCSFCIDIEVNYKKLIIPPYTVFASSSSSKRPIKSGLHIVTRWHILQACYTVLYCKYFYCTDARTAMLHLLTSGPNPTGTILSFYQV